MFNIKKALIACLLATVLALNPLTATASQTKKNKNREPADPAAMIVDLVIARPLGLAVTVAGSAFFVVSLPFAALGGNTGDTWQSLVVNPAEYTFARPLGEFDD